MDERSLFFIDIFAGETSTVSEEECEEKMLEAQPLVEFYNQTVLPSKEQLALEEENKHIMKTRMRLHRETVHVSYVQSFNDNYHRDKGDVTTEEEAEARALKRRYPQYADYCQAMLIYNDYMDKLYDKYGNKELFRLYEKAGKVTEFVPAEPKIKPTSTNKAFKKYNVLLSPKSKTKENYVDVFHMDIEEIYQLMNTEAFDPNEEIKIKRFNKDKADKSVLEMVEEAENGSSKRFAKARDQAMLHGGMDFIAEYFGVKNKYDKDKKLKEEYDENLTLQDLLDDNFITEEDLQKDTNEMIWYNGMMVKKSALEDEAVYRQLNDLGWNTKKIYKNTVSEDKKGIAYELLKRADKKEKKKNKKDKKKNKLKDDFMTTLIFDNNYDSFADFEDDMLNVVASDIFGNDINNNIK